ncbi:MAG: S8 family peptidase [Chitinophagales bacterium]|nr:S8 family peptidase [Chitinophagales bacterium]MDW8428142.1 S8 family peptidase [Chitinophagales bacterium]
MNFSLRLVVALSLMLPLAAKAQLQEWFLLDPQRDGVYGAAVQRAYQELLKDKTGQTVVVAVLDGGTDITHEDLKSVLWRNSGEQEGNGLDDDRNGYVDDVHGWNFIGGKNGSVQYDQMELTRLYKMMLDRYGTQGPPPSDPNHAEYLRLRFAYEQKVAETEKEYQLYSGLYRNMKLLQELVGTQDPPLDQLLNLDTLPDSLTATVFLLSGILDEETSFLSLYEALGEYVKHLETGRQYHYNLNFDPRPLVGDNYLDASERYYGNADVAGPDATHGTHVAGIIAADRTNQTGTMGVADNVRIMVLRCVPDGDERDKDVANSIRYAVDHGARIINMSFGKSYSFNKQVVDNAVRYAMQKDVLIVHGAGNDHLNTDKTSVYPNPYFADGGKATNFINVGASTPDGKPADFSNYGKKTVDVFAPGVNIYSTVPENKYRSLQGTSMAAPVVAGTAALIRSYYPQLTAEQIRKILIKSVTKMKGKAPLPGSGKRVRWKRLCVSAGIVNAYQALLLAERFSRNSR